MIAGKEPTSAHVQGAEDEARRVYADKSAEAVGEGYDFVTLRCPPLRSARALSVWRGPPGIGRHRTGRGQVPR